MNPATDFQAGPARGQEPKLSVSRLRGADRVWLLTALLAFGALSLFLLARLLHLQPLAAPLHLEWWMLVLPFGFTEIFVVNLPFRRETLTFSLSEIPLIIGLFFAAPEQLLLGQMVGAGLGLLLHRRQPLIKLCFNLSNLAFTTGIAVLLFNLILGAADPLGPLGWLATFGVAMLVELVGLVTILTAITLSATRPSDMGRQFGSGIITTFFNTTLALTIVTLLWSRPETAWLPAALASLLFLSYQAHGSLRRKQESLEVLYDSTRHMQESLHAGNVIATILTQAREMFHADRAELLLLSEDGTRPLLSSLTGESEILLMKPVDLAPTEGVWARVTSEATGILLARPMNNDRLREHFAARDIKDAMVVPIRGEGAVLGTILVGNHLGDVSTFTAEDMRFFETFANHASIALQNQGLVDKLRKQAADMEHEALHDILTGLPNRTLLRNRIEAALGGRRAGDQRFAVLLMDIDRFKEVNDTIGHHNGDLLLQEFANRLTSVLGPLGHRCPSGRRRVRRLLA